MKKYFYSVCLMKRSSSYLPELSHASQQCSGKGASRGATHPHPHLQEHHLLSVVMSSGTGNSHFSEKATGTLASCSAAILHIQDLDPRKKENEKGMQDFLTCMPGLFSLLTFVSLPKWSQESVFDTEIALCWREKGLCRVWRTWCLKKTLRAGGSLLKQQGILWHACSLSDTGDNTL